MFLTQVQRKILPYDETKLVETEICIANRDIVAFEATPQPVKAADGTVVPCAVCRYKTLQPDGSFIHRSVCVKGTAEQLTAQRFPERATPAETKTGTTTEIDATTGTGSGTTSTKKKKSEVTSE